MPRRVGRRSKGRHTSGRARNQEPLAEGIAPQRKNGQRAWASMSDDGLVAFTKAIMKEKGIRWSKELKKTDAGLYESLRKRKLLDKVGFEEKKRKSRPWKDMSDAELVAFAKKFMEEKKISTRAELYKADSGLYTVLKRRNLMDEAGLESNRITWFRGKKRKLTSDEIEAAKDRRRILMSQGLPDGTIARKIGGETGIRFSSLERLFLRLRREKEIPENPNKKEHKDYTEKEIENMINRRSTLVHEGLNDKEIARKIGKETGRSIHSLDEKIRVFVREGELPENPHKKEHKKFTKDETQTIKQMRRMLISEGLIDKEIARKIAKTIGRDVDAVIDKIRKLMRSGRLPKNPNKKEQKFFTDKELESIIKTRNSLIQQGFTDLAIAKKIGKETGRAPLTLHQKVRQLVKEGKIPENTNKKIIRTGFFAGMSDDGLVDYANKILEENPLSYQYELKEIDSGLLAALRRRKLLKRLKFQKKLPEITKAKLLGRRKPREKAKWEPRKRVSWVGIADDELVEYAKDFIKERGIKNRKGLEREAPRLYDVLRKRKLLDNVPFEQKKKETRKWFLLSDDELFEYGKKFVEENKIKSKNGVFKADQRLYVALLKRKLLDKMGFEEGQRNWASMSDEELLGHAKKVVEENGIKSKSELEKHDSGLHAVLGRRKLLDKIYFMRTQPMGRDWASMSDDEVVDHAKRFTKVNRISWRGELAKADSGLYDVLLRRELLDRLEFKEKKRNWASMSDDELVKETKKLIEEKGIKTRSQLGKKLSGLYKALETRELFERVGFGPPKKFAKPRRFRAMSDEELVDFAKKVIEEKGIRNRCELARVDGGLNVALRERGLIDKVGLEMLVAKSRDWKSMNDDQLLDFARRFFEEHGIRNGRQLRKKDAGLLEVLRKRNLLDKVGFKEGYRVQNDWNHMSDAELVAFAQRFMKEKGLRWKKELSKADRGLYAILVRRKLVGAVFRAIKPPSEDTVPLNARGQRDWTRLNDEEIVAYTRKFMREKGISGRKELWDAASGLYQALRRRGLLGKLGFEEKRRDWASMSDEELVGYAARFIRHNGIQKRGELEDADCGLYEILRKRRLLDLAFADAEKITEGKIRTIFEGEIRAIFDALTEFDDAQ